MKRSAGIKVANRLVLSRPIWAYLGNHSGICCENESQCAPEKNTDQTTIFIVAGELRARLGLMTSVKLRSRTGSSLGQTFVRGAADGETHTRTRGTQSTLIIATTINRWKLCGYVRDAMLRGTVNIGRFHTRTHPVEFSPCKHLTAAEKYLAFVADAIGKYREKKP